jgi:response regulator RpfG family c-di-GMP phosphodiesterase
MLDRHLKVSIKAKLLIMIVPLLFCSYFISSYITITTSKKSLSDLSTRFMRYKSEQIQNYAFDQWENFNKSSFADEPVYAEIIRKSIGTYARGIIREDSELIFALENTGELVFSTSSINIDRNIGLTVLYDTPVRYETLEEFLIDDKKYVGLRAELSDFNWQVFLLEEKQSYNASSRLMTYRQLYAFAASLLIIVTGLILTMSVFLKPLNRVRRTIHDIKMNRDFTRKINIDYPDEIGALAFEFNDMTANLDHSYKKLKKYAINEAIARKEVDVREKESLKVLGSASDYKDPETGAHIVRVSAYSLVLSKSLGQPESIQDLIYYSSPLHDIGKLGVPDSVLLKEGRLTEEEFAVIKTHTTMGYEILKGSTSKYLKAGSIIALSHHEKYDGTGYPKGLAGEDIPILGRIVSIADVFDALTTKRHYKEAWTFEKAITYINEVKGSQFDPEVVERFLAILPDIRKIYENCDYMEMSSHIPLFS